MRFVRTAENLFGLPQGFTRVEYLETSASKYYIDTGYKANNTTKVEIKTQGQTWTFGGRTSLAVGDSLGICFNANLVALQFGSQSINYNQTGIAQQVSECVISQDGAYINGVLLASFTSETFSCQNNLYLFDINNNGSLGDGLKGKMWYCKIWDNNTLVRDFIPCIDPLGVACMYDLVGKKPYYNAGTGTFTAGRQIIPVEYLESTGTEYIDTGYKPVPATTKFEFYFNPTTISGNYFLFGARPDTSIGGFTCTTYFATGNIRQDWAGLGSYFAKINAGAKSLYSAYNNTVSLNNDSATGTVVRSTDRSNYNFLLFTVNTAGTVDSRMFVGKVYYAKLWDNGTLVRDFIPCKDENNVGFMFDKVSGTVYLNAGTGAFSVGENKYTSKLRLIRDAIRIPEGYTRVEYLESTGTQYIDTGIKLNNNSSVELDYQLTQATQSRTGLFGALNMSGSNQGRFGSLLSPSNQQLEHGYGSGNDYWQQGLPDTNIHKLYQKKNEVYFDGTLIHTFSSATFSLATNAYLGNFVYTNYTPAKAKYYRSKWWDNGTLVRSFIPVRDENNVGYMFDEVTGQLFGNAGSGSFGIGNDLQKPKVRFIQDVIPSDYLPLKYLQSSGTQYILTGFTPTLNTDFEIELSSTDTLTRWVMGCPTWVGVHYKNGTEVGITNSSTSAFQKYTSYNHDNSKLTMKLVGSTVYANGVSLGTITRRAGTLDFALFGYRDANQGATLFFVGNIYKCTIWDNGVPVRDFYPALRKSDNKPGMYDRITKQFFTNDATSGNDFNYG